MWEKWLKIRTAAWKKVARITDSRLYKSLYLVALFVFLGGIFDSYRNSVSESFISALPRWIFWASILFMAPAMIVAFDKLRTENLKRYNPKAPEIQKMIKRWRRVGWIAIVIAIFVFSLIVFFAEYIDAFPVWFWSASLIVPIFVGVFALHRASDMKSGMWTPPEWMPSMYDEETEPDEDSK